jgi:hypothetical protein
MKELLIVQGPIVTVRRVSLQRSFCSETRLPGGANVTTYKFTTTYNAVQNGEKYFCFQNAPGYSRSRKILQHWHCTHATFDPRIGSRVYNKHTHVHTYVYSLCIHLHTTHTTRYT